MPEPTWGSASHHRRVAVLSPNRRRQCWCGCGGRATHMGTANSVTLMIGCEWTVRKWVQAQDQRVLARHMLEAPNA